MWVRVACSSPKASGALARGAEGKGFPLWAGLGWGERPAPSRCETGLPTVGPFLLALFPYLYMDFIPIFILSLLYEMRTSQVVFVFPVCSHRTTANGSRAKARGFRLTHFAAVA